MTNRVNNKSQAKHLKKRKERANKASYRHVGINANRITETRTLGDNKIFEMMRRGQEINAQGLTPKAIMDMINQTVEVNAGIGSIIETIEILEKEGKLTLTEDQKADVIAFDEGSVKFSETAQFVSIILNGEQTTHNLPEELLMDLAFRSNDMVTVLSKKIFGWAKEYTDLVNTYQKEHYPEQPYREIMYKVALARLQRVTPAYRTPPTVEGEDVTDEALEATDAHDILDNATGKENV